MSKFLSVLRKDTETGDRYRRYVTDTRLLDLIDMVNDGKIDDPQEIERAENAVQMKLGRPVLVQEIMSLCADDITPKPINPEPINPEPPIEPAIITADDTTEETEEIVVYEMKIGYGTKAMSDMGTFSGDGTYQEGVDIPIEATPNEGYEFKGWKQNGRGEFITNNPLLVSMDGNKTYKAYFEAVVEE